MSNVYVLVEHFYESDFNYDMILPQNVIEKYLRRKAWQGAGDEELKQIWEIVSLMVSYVEQLHLYSLGSLTINDLHEVIYRYAQDDKECLLDELSVMKLVAHIEDFLIFWSKNGSKEDWRSFMDDVKKSFYVQNHFVMPPRRMQDEFYSSLEHQEEVSDEDMQQLNQMMDALLHRMDDFFQQPAYRPDMDRAMLMFVGPDGDTYHRLPEEEMQSFWIGFWDFFLFDYHMLETDETAIRFYYRLEKERLSAAECDILLDLMQAKFGIYSIDYYDVDFVSCHNLLTDEPIELPMPAMMDGVVDGCLLYGHVHSKGVMMLNYVTILPASRKLQRRMRQEIFKQYELFKCQQPEAPLEAFLLREAAAVRHTMNILAHFAQLNVVPNHVVKPQEFVGDVIWQLSEEDRRALVRFSLKFGLSKFSAQLICKLFADYIAALGEDYENVDKSVLVTAVFLKFAEINGSDVAAIPEIVKFLGTSSDDVFACMDDMRIRLDTFRFDPRYLTEEGFIRSLYWE
ncbi:hypothetical protein SAMN02910356_00643 [Selenomonas sp. GACV-9]|uniref:hypothetical protein n=1 Tax=Selenomonas sp. GACV-9 TaxID=3158782 RepID=UPI0008F42CF0|nr:hypothetical protein SAMN02910356_00643 [Selenomonas ruminantium]